MTNPPINPTGANLYAQGFGSVPSNNLSSAIQAARNPASTDIRGPSGSYPIGQQWINTSTGAVYSLTAYSSSSAVVSASWTVLGGSSSDVNNLAGDSGTANPSSGTITIAGGAGVVTSGSGSTITVALTGGGVAIDSFVPDTGTNPVVPNVSGGVNMTGTANQITTTGGTSVLTFSLPSVLIAPGSIAAASSITAATNVISTSGNITAVAGQLIAGGDAGSGNVSTTALTNGNSTTIGAGTGTVKMTSGNNANSAVWIKVYVGTTAYWVPGWTTNSP